MRAFALLALPLLAACVEPTTTPRPGGSTTAPAATSSNAAHLTPSQANREFVRVVQTIEPVAEAECRRRAPRSNCDFLIVIDDRPNQPPNAFQTLDDTGRPVIAFNLGLIAMAHNADELAFVLGHEAAHHINGHIARTQANAATGALIFAGLAALTGAGENGVRAAQDIGATVGARSYSKDFELEADALGTRITARAGYDPVRGAAFFTRIPDPGNRFLGTHPPNAARIETVRREAARL